MSKHQLGYQVGAELYGCDRRVLDDVAAVERHMLAAAAACGATVVAYEFHRFQPHGVSGVVIIAESHLAVHTWPEHRYAAVDVFTCGRTLRPEAAVEHLQAAFGSEGAEVERVDRGLPWASPIGPHVEARHGLFTAAAAAPSGVPRELAEQVYVLPLLDRELCRVIVEETERVGASSFADLPGACRLWGRLVAEHLKPRLEALWPSFRLQRWDVPKLSLHEPGGNDSVLGATAGRVGLVAFLNDGFEGGGLRFPRWDLAAGGSATLPPGSAVVYPAGLSHEHCFPPVHAGRSHLLVASLS